MHVQECVARLPAIRRERLAITMLRRHSNLEGPARRLLGEVIFQAIIDMRGVRELGGRNDLRGEPGFWLQRDAYDFLMRRRRSEPFCECVDLDWEFMHEVLRKLGLPT